MGAAFCVRVRGSAVRAIRRALLATLLPLVDPMHSRGRGDAGLIRFTVMRSARQSFSLMDVSSAPSNI